MDDDHGSTVKRVVGVDGDQSWRTSSAKWTQTLSPVPEISDENRKRCPS